MVCGGGHGYHPRGYRSIAHLASPIRVRSRVRVWLLIFCLCCLHLTPLQYALQDGLFEELFCYCVSIFMLYDLPRLMFIGTLHTHTLHGCLRTIIGTPLIVLFFP